MSLEMGTNFEVDFAISEADLIANVQQEFIAPHAGWLYEFATTIQKAITTGGTLTVKQGDSLAVTVAGVVQTIANSATVGTRQTTKSTNGDSSAYLLKGARFSITPASFATAGRVSGVFRFNSAGNNT